MAAAGSSSGQDIASIEMEDSTLGTSGITSTITYYESNTDDADDSPEKFQTVHRKKRKASNSSQTSNNTFTPVHQTPSHLVVVLEPKDPTKMIATINPLKITDKLEMTAPDGIILVRPNRRLNLLAIDTRNRDATKALLALTTIGGIQVQAYEPLPRDSAACVIYGVTPDITDEELRMTVRATAPVISVRRLGSSETVKVLLRTDTLPECVTIGYTRYKTVPFVEKPRQCSKCNGLGHIRTACTKEARCTRCGGEHESTSCNADNPLCTNCGKAHDSTSRLCPAFQREQRIYKYKSEAKVGYKTAKEALLASKGRLTEDPSNASISRTKQLLKNEVSLQRHSTYTSAEQTNAVQGKRYGKKTVDNTAAFELNNEQEYPPLPVRVSNSTVKLDERRKQAEKSQTEKPIGQQLPTSETKIQSVVNVIRNLLSSWDSPIAKAIITLIDTCLPLMMLWRH